MIINFATEMISGIPSVQGVSESVSVEGSNSSLHTVEGTTVRVDWDSPPSPPQIDSVNNAIASGSYATWLAEHDGDPVLTLRRKAREAIDSPDEDAALIRAAFLELATAHNQLIQWLGSQAVLTNRGQLSSLVVTRQGIKDRINAGEADN